MSEPLVFSPLPEQLRPRPIRLEFLPVTSLGKPREDTVIGYIPDAVAVPARYDSVMLGGMPWRVVDLVWDYTGDHEVLVTVTVREGL